MSINGQIYKYNQLLSRVDYELENNGGEVTPEVEGMLTEIQSSEVAVADDLYGFTAEKKAFIETCKAEKKRIGEMQKTAENSLESIKGWLLKSMLQNGVEKIEGNLHKVAVAAGRESVEITSESALLSKWEGKIAELQAQLPPYIVLKYEVSKSALAECLKEGELIEGAEIVRNPSLNIR